MRAITIWQPWASLVAFGAKRIETRHWTTRYRGPILIHAAKRWTADEVATSMSDPFWDVLAANGYEDPGLLPKGAIVAVARLTEIIAAHGHDSMDRVTSSEFPEHELDFGYYAPGRFGWVLSNVRALGNPVECVGQQGLWSPADDLVDRVRLEYEASRGAA